MNNEEEKTEHVIRNLREKFVEIFGGSASEEPELPVFFAPGRVNLIGEHTDYNGGHVMPCALSLGTYGTIKKRADGLMRFYSVNFPAEGIVCVSPEDPVPGDDHPGSWTAYPTGVVRTLALKGFPVSTGFDMLVSGDIPTGSGLSSSASLEVLTALMLRDTFGFEDLSMIDLALIGQYAENNFCGADCGIMDQFVSAMGKKDHAILLDTNTLKYEYVPLDLGDAKIVVVNSRVKHSIASSGYNDRRKECVSALADLQKEGVRVSSTLSASSGTESGSETGSTIGALCELDAAEFEKYKNLIKDTICRKRAKHAVYENERTIDAAKALKAGDLEEFGRLMNGSHISLRDNYETSCPECDILAETAWNISGVYGSRITGGGFGGCTVSIVKNEAIESFTEIVKKEYKEKTGLEPEIYTACVSDGARRID